MDSELLEQAKKLSIPVKNKITMKLPYGYTSSITLFAIVDKFAKQYNKESADIYVDDDGRLVACVSVDKTESELQHDVDCQTASVKEKIKQLQRMIE